LHQWQRKKDKQGRIIATWFDYDFARFVFTILKDIEGVTLNSAEEEFILFLREQNVPISIKEADEKFIKRSKAWIYNHLDSFRSKGLIEISYETVNLNKDIKKIRATKLSEGVGLPSSIWFYNKLQYELEKDQQKEFKSFQSFYQILKVLDKNREKIGLTPIFEGWYNKPVENQENLEANTKSTEENNILNQNKKGVEPGEKLHEKILKLEKTIEKHKKVGCIINDAFLSHYFDEEDVKIYKEKGLLIKLPNDEYDVRMG
jgi:hypothetical protein